MAVTWAPLKGEDFDVSQLITTCKDWVDTIREDVETVKKIVEADKVDDDARKFAASALNYLVSRMDLIPDWTDTIGVIDDVIVLRVCVNLANSYGLDDLDTSAMVAATRLANQAEAIESAMNEDMYAKIRKYCARLSDVTVRGRSPEGVIRDEEVRADLYREIEDDIKKMPAANFKDAESVELKLQSYLHAKLKEV